MASGVGGMAGIGAANDPRLDSITQGGGPTHLLEKLHDPSIPIEEYLHYAKITRAEEDRLYGPGSDYQASAGPATKFFKSKIMRKPVDDRVVDKPRLSVSAQGEAQIHRPSISEGATSSDEKVHKTKFEPMVISDEEWVTASRAARTATW